MTSRMGTNETKCLSATVDALITGFPFIGRFTVVWSSSSSGNQWLSRWERLYLVSIMQSALSLHHLVKPRWVCKGFIMRLNP